MYLFEWMSGAIILSLIFHDAFEDYVFLLSEPPVSRRLSKLRKAVAVFEAGQTGKSQSVGRMMID